MHIEYNRTGRNFCVQSCNCALFLCLLPLCQLAVPLQNIGLGYGYRLSCGNYGLNPQSYNFRDSKKKLDKRDDYILRVRSNCVGTNKPP